jgi:hypothetical protein
MCKKKQAGSFVPSVLLSRNKTGEDILQALEVLSLIWEVLYITVMYYKPCQQKALLKMIIYILKS